MHIYNCCGFEQEMYSNRVHVTEGGSVKTYAGDEELTCPNCSRDEPEDKVLHGQQFLGHRNTDHLALL